jgi:hypothetical protein
MAGHFLIEPEDLFWRPAILMQIPNEDYLERLVRENPGGRLWRLPLTVEGFRNPSPS